MYKLFLIFISINTYIFANINVIVSIPPQKTFLNAVAKERANATLMVEAGNSPHTYEPKPSQMIAVAEASLYFAIDIEFEHVWLSRFVTQNKNLHIINTAKGIKKIQMKEEKHTYNHDTHKDHHHRGTDPHIWTTPKNVKIIAQNIYTALITHDKKNTPYYKKNLDTFLASIEKTDKTIRSLLSTLKGSRSFMVFHPSWGYFAKEYNLKQISVEVEGKSPKPRELIEIIKRAKQERVKAIFTQPEFSDKSAKIIAKELNIPVIKVTPMNEKWSENLISIAKTIAGKKQ
jgi:zinc transport system substrate-binding protein